MAKLGIALMGAGISSALGFGPAVGWAIAGTVGSMLLGPKPPTIFGPRLTDLKVSSSAFGDPRAQVWGTQRVGLELVWSSGLKPQRREQEVDGKGFGGGQKTVTEFATIDARFSATDSLERPIVGITKLWAGGKLIYDVGDGPASLDLLQRNFASNLQAEKITVYTGAEDQMPDPLEESYMGVGNTLAYRGSGGIVFDDWNLEAFGNRLPPLEAEVVTEGAAQFKEIHQYTNPEVHDGSNNRGGFAHVDENGEFLNFTWTPLSQHTYESDLAFLARATPFGAFREVKLSESLLPPGAPAFNDSSLKWETIKVTSDVPGFGFMGTFQGGNFYFADYAENKWHHIGNFNSRDIIVKKGNNFLSARGIGETQKIVLWQNGLKVRERTFSFVPRDIGIGDDFFYVLENDPNTIHRIDKTDLSTVASWTLNLPAATNPDADMIFVEADDEIYIARRLFNEGPIEIYKLVEGEVTLVGSAAYTGSMTKNHTVTFYHRNGLFYVGGRVSSSGVFPHIWVFGFTTQGDCVPLSVIQGDINRRCGIPPSRYDVTELTDCVHGVPRGKQMTGRVMTEMLQKRYFYDGRISNLKLQFVKRGKQPLLTIKEDELAAHEYGSEMPPVMESDFDAEYELPRRVHVVYANKDANHQSGHQYSSRLITEAKEEVTVEVPISMSNAEGKLMADVLMADAWQRRKKRTIRVTDKYARLDPADVIGVETARSAS